MTDTGAPGGEHEQASPTEPSLATAGLGSADVPSSADPAHAGAEAGPKRKIAWRPLIGVGVLAAFLLFGWIANRGKTSGDDLMVGDCFELPDGNTFVNVVNQDCVGPHQAQVFAELSPTDVQDGVDNECFAALIPLLTSAELPEDFALSAIELGGESAGFCVVTSPSGQLVGSLVE